MFSKISIVCFLACAAGIAPTAFADNVPSNQLTLSIDEDAPGAEAMLRGDYAAAVDAVRLVDHRSEDISAQHTLCAAYIAQRLLPEAELACDTALQLAQSMITTARYPHGHKDRDGLEKAFSNRAVLRLLQGDTKAADTDIASAQKYGRKQMPSLEKQALDDSVNSVASAVSQ